MGKSERRTVRPNDRDQPLESEPRDLPARREGRTAPAERDPSLEVFKDAWGSLVSSRACMAYAQLLRESFPELSDADLVRQFDILGGRPYANVEHYLNILNDDPRVLGPPRWIELVPGTGEWTEWIGDQVDEAKIVAAYLCEVERLNELTREAYTWREAGVCRKSDVVLYKGGKTSRGLEDDWEFVAKKTARSRALRRVCRMMYSTSEARRLRAARQVEARARALAVEEGEATGGRGLIEPADPYAREDEPSSRLPESGEAVEAADPLKQPIDGEARGYLFGLMQGRETGELTNYDALHRAIAKVQGLEDPDEASIANLTAGEFEDVVEAIDELYPAPRGNPVQEVEAEDVTDDEAETDQGSLEV